VEDEFTVLRTGKPGKFSYMYISKEGGWGYLKGTNKILEANRYGSANSAAYNVGGHAKSYTPVRIKLTSIIEEIAIEEFGTDKEIGWDD
jgi:hypothetical protein